MIPLFKPDLGKEEEQEVVKALRSNWIGNGPKTLEFEKRFLAFIGSRYGVATNSASAALHLALISSGVKEGDEVITPSLTFVATNHPILMLGAVPVFCDVEYDTLCANVDDIRRKISEKTKAIIVVHYGGHPVDLRTLVSLCKIKKIKLIEDCAHASGSYYRGRHVGTFGDFGCFSFAAIKNLTTGDGGMIVGKNKRMIEKARSIAWSGISQSTWERSKGKKLKWQYIVNSVGWKYQMNDIAASIGLSQLAKLNKNNKKREKIVERYNKKLKGVSWIELPVIKKYARSSFHNYVIKVAEKNRDHLSNYLSEKGIATSVHYMPSHMYKIYSSFSAKVPVTNKVWKKILLLPVFPSLKISEQDYIIKNIKSFKTQSS